MDIFENGFLREHNFQALENLFSICADDVIPFIKIWWENANNDNIKKSEVKNLQNKSRFELYSWLPEFLDNVSNLLKFDNRNFLNIHPNPFIPSILANLITSIQNPNCVAKEVSEAMWDMEEYCIKWFAKNLIGFQEDRCWGNVVSGGTLANMTALLVARDYTYNKLSKPRNDEIGAWGVIGRPPGVVLTSKSSHYSLKKALWFLGMGHENLIQIPVAVDEEYRRAAHKEEKFLNGIRDNSWRVPIENFQKIEKGNDELDKFYSGYQRPFSLQPLNSELFKALYSCFQYNIPLIAYVLNFGTTFTGTIEELNTEAFTKLLNEDIYFHVDAAWGGFGLACSEIKRKASLLSLADSITIDGHKLGLLPYSSGSIVFKDINTKHQILQNAPYLQNVAPTLEGSRAGSNIASLWSGLKAIGEDGYAYLIDRMLSMTKIIAKLLEDSKRFQILHRVDLNAIAFAPLPLGKESRHDVNGLCRKIKHQINTSSVFRINFEDSLCGIKVLNHPSSSLEPELVEIQSLRLVVSNPYTEQKNAEEFTKLLCETLDSIRKV